MPCTCFIFINYFAYYLTVFYIRYFKSLYLAIALLCMSKKGKHNRTAAEREKETMNESELATVVRKENEEGIACFIKQNIKDIIMYDNVSPHLMSCLGIYLVTILIQ